MLVCTFLDRIFLSYINRLHIASSKYNYLTFIIRTDSTNLIKLMAFLHIEKLKSFKLPSYHPNLEKLKSFKLPIYRPLIAPYTARLQTKRMPERRFTMPNRSSTNPFWHSRTRSTPNANNQSSRRDGIGLHVDVFPLLFALLFLLVAVLAPFIAIGYYLSLWLIWLTRRSMCQGWFCWLWYR